MKGSRTVWGIAAAALALRLLLLFVRGDYIVYDEGYYLLLARSLRAGHGFALSGLPHVALSPLQPLLVAALSFTGLPDLWASRLLAAVCGTLLVVPVAALAEHWYGRRAAVTAAAFTALAPALLTFLPFFPGRGWNLYFGSEPLYLLLAVGAIALGRRAVEAPGVLPWIGVGALAALAYLTRLEGIVLAAALGSVMVGALVVRGELKRWPLALAALAAGALIAAPYLFYLHGTLGRWVLSGRVQAAASAAAAAAPPVQAAGPGGGGGSEAVRDFVWGGDTESLWRTLYALDASGTRMASQYWGVPPRPEAAEAPAANLAADSDASRSVAPAATPGAAPAAGDSAAARAATPSEAATLVRAILVVVPWWFILLALYGIVRAHPVRGVVLWLAPAALASLVPALLAYAEPRALLLLVPAACITAAGAVEYLGSLLAKRAPRARPAMLVPLAVGIALAVPTLRNLVDAWGQQTPLQQLAAARRVVGEAVGHDAPGGPVVAWHPAVALWAHRDWRVMPYDTFGRIVRYAQAQHAPVIVFSRFNPSPLRDPPRAFTAFVVDSAYAATDDQVHVEPLENLPMLFVGRLVNSAPEDAPR